MIDSKNVWNIQDWSLFNCNVISKDFKAAPSHSSFRSIGPRVAYSSCGQLDVLVYQEENDGRCLPRINNNMRKFVKKGLYKLRILSK